MSIKRTKQGSGYWVYDNPGAKHARVHRATCFHCRYGKGRRIGSSPYGRWLGPYADGEEAMAVARGLKRSNTKACPECAPLTSLGPAA
jgi:hypothetical protein